MNEWLHNLPVVSMALVIFAIVYLVTGAIFAVIILLGPSLGRFPSNPMCSCKSGRSDG